VHHETRRPDCVDIRESIRPGQGMFDDNFSGFVDPSCPMIGKLACPMVPRYRNFPLALDPALANRNIFRFLSRNHTERGSGGPAVFYALNENDGQRGLSSRGSGGIVNRRGRLIRIKPAHMIRHNLGRARYCPDAV